MSRVSVTENAPGAPGAFSVVSSAATGEPEPIMQRNHFQKALTSLVDNLVEKGITLEQASREFERQFLIASIRRNDGNLSRSAQSLGVHRNTLRNKLGRLGVTAKDYAGKTPRIGISR
jgi:DNA-binding NtrC family response regulator